EDLEREGQRLLEDAPAEGARID
ncbi:MAG: hypothetical protein RLZZ598_1431, partial [Pseudomonadota bacterium]